MRGAQAGDTLEVPFAPFCGVMGVAPAEAGRLDTMPPRRNGGNVDVRHLTAGTRAFFPVCVPGANFATGDGHVALSTRRRGTVAVTSSNRCASDGTAERRRPRAARRSPPGPERIP